MSAHLFRRQGGTYFFRRAIPVALRSHFQNRREWIASLRTKDRSEAKRLLPSFVIAFDNAMESARTINGQRPPDRLIDPAPDKAALMGLQVEKRVRSKSPCVPLIATFEAYSNEQGLKPTTSNEWRAIISKFVAFVGHDDAARISTNDVDRWRDALLSEIDRNGVRRSAGTVRNKYLCALKATLTWAVDKRLIAVNSATASKVRVGRSVKLRDRDFTTDEACRILLASLGPQPSTLPELQGRARRWVPWLCAYTGARVNEVGQLRGSDIRKIGGVWTVTITPDAGTVKSDKARLIPLHPHLLEQGFVAIAHAVGNQPMFFDPTATRKPGSANRYQKKVGEKLRDWVRNEVGISDPNVQPNHAWRHTFKTRAFDAGIPERVADAIQGHAPRSVGQGYGTVSLAAKAKAIDLMPRFEV